MMPQAPTSVSVPTRPRLGFSIESLLVGCGGDEKRSSVSPPLPGLTKMVSESPISREAGNINFQRELLAAREQVFREQLLKEQLMRVQQAREIQRNEQLLQQQQQQLQQQQQHISPITSPVRTHSPTYEDIEKKITPPTSPVPQQPIPFMPTQLTSSPQFPPQLFHQLQNQAIPPHMPTPLLPHQLLAAQQNQLNHLGTPLPPHPGREYPLYPWLLSRQGRIFPPGFPVGPDFPFLLPFRKPKRIRTAFSPSQLLKLEQAFEKNQYVVGAERKQLARDLNLSETQVKVWFQNRRTKHKRQATEDGEEVLGEDGKPKPVHDDEELVLEHEEDEELDVETEPTH